MRQIKSAIMYFICIAYFLDGLNLYSLPDSDRQILKTLDPSTTAQLDLLSTHQMAYLFTTVCVVCFGLTMWGKVHIAYGLMTFLVLFWALLFLVSWAITGYWQSIYNGAQYFLTTAVLVMCSKIVETPTREGGNK
jgi:hypothetical protein